MAFEKFIEPRPRCQPNMPGQFGKSIEQPRDDASCVTAWGNDVDFLAMTADWQTAVPRNKLKRTVWKRKIAPVDFSKVLHCEAGMEGEAIQIRVFVDDAALNQNLIRTNADLAAVALRRGQKRSCEHAAQAIEFGRWF